MTAGTIQAEYEQLDNISRRFGQQAKNSVNFMRCLQRNVDNLRHNGWAGEAAEAFFAEMEYEIFPVMSRLNRAFEQAQFVTLEVKDVIQGAEEEAAEPFKGLFLEQVGNLASNNNNPPDVDSTLAPAHLTDDEKLVHYGKYSSKTIGREGIIDRYTIFLKKINAQFDRMRESLHNPKTGVEVLDKLRELGEMLPGPGTKSQIYIDVSNQIALNFAETQEAGRQIRKLQRFIKRRGFPPLTEAEKERLAKLVDIPKEKLFR